MTARNTKRGHSLSETPTATPRVLLAAFQGWGDAGEAATDTLQHISKLQEAEVLHSIGASGYIDFQAHRPRVTRDVHGKRKLEWPETKLFGPLARPGIFDELDAEGLDAEVLDVIDALESAGITAVAAPSEAGKTVSPAADDASAAEAADEAGAGSGTADSETPGADRAGSAPERITRIDGSPVSELYLLAGYEPAYNWQDFAEEIVDLVDTWQFDSVILIGSMFAEAPHSRQIATTITSDSPKLRENADADTSEYEGPVGIGTVIELALVAADVPTVSLWAQIPHYVHSAPSPKATLALLDKLEELLDVVIPRGDLLAESNEWEQHINRIAEGDDEMSQYIRALERQRDDALAAGTTGDAIALEFEKLLTRDVDTKLDAAIDQDTQPETPDTTNTAPDSHPAEGDDEPGAETT